MNRRRLHARLISEYLDARLSADSARGRSDASAASSKPTQTEFDQLFDLARELADLDLEPPPTLESRLLTRLTYAPPEDLEPETWHDRARAVLLGVRRPLFGLPRWLLAGAGALAALVAIVFLWGSGLTRVSTASAEEVLRRNGAGLERLAEPGQWLYRRWRVLMRGPAGLDGAPSEQIVSEWADGNDPTIVAGQGTTPDGRLLWRYVTALDGDVYRPHVYFTPAYPGSERASMYIRPSDDEIVRAFEALPVSERPGVDEDYQNLVASSYVPILSDRRFNRSALEARSRPGSLFGAVGLDMEQVVDGNGRQAYRVRILRPVELAFRWAPSGPVVKVGRSEVTKDISADRFLTLRATIDRAYPDGSHVLLIHTSEEVRTVPARSASSPFHLEIPPGTRVHRHTAAETVRAIKDALSAAGKTAPNAGAIDGGQRSPSR